MPYCTRCDVEYQEGFTVCADCGATLAEAPPEREAATAEWSVLTEVGRETEARLVQGRLEAEGIRCALESRTFTAEPIPSVRSFARVSLHVLTKDLERAKEVLATCEAEVATTSEEPEADS